MVGDIVFPKLLHHANYYQLLLILRSFVKMLKNAFDTKTESRFCGRRMQETETKQKNSSGIGQKERPFSDELGRQQETPAKRLTK